jgi:hypothetical protein
MKELPIPIVVEEGLDSGFDRFIQSRVVFGYGSLFGQIYKHAPT